MTSPATPRISTRKQPHHVRSRHRDAPEARRLRVAVTRTARAFVREALPYVPAPERLVAADIIMMSMTAVGKQVSEAGYAPAAIDARGRALGDMFCAYLESVRASAASAGPAKSPSRASDL